MSERRLHAQVGLLFILSVTVLVFGILWFKEFNIKGRTYHQTVEFGNTSGLVKGDPVEVKGVPSGKVLDIRFEEGLALVDLQIDHDVKLYKNAAFSIESLGLMGQKIVSIQPGSRRAGDLSHDDIPKGVYRGGISEVMNGVSDALDVFQRLAGRVDSLLAGVDGGDRRAKLGKTLDHMERASREFALVLEDNRAALAHSVRTMGAAMDDLHSMLDGREEQFGEILDSAGSATARLDTTLASLDRTVARMDTLLARVENGQGTLGKVLQEDDLYQQFVTTLADAKALLQDVRQNPKRYFKFSVF